jgi:hypothetical protein
MTGPLELNVSVALNVAANSPVVLPVGQVQHGIRAGMGYVGLRQGAAGVARLLGRHVGEHRVLKGLLRVLKESFILAVHAGRVGA